MTHHTHDAQMVGFSDHPEHDWNYLLGTMHMLPMDHALALLLRACAAAIGAASLTLGVWLLIRMQRSAR